MGTKATVNRTTNNVDWNDPSLQALLGKIEDWNLDNREIHPRQQVLVQVGWNASGGKSATLVWKRDRVMVLETDLPLPIGEHVRVDVLLGDATRSVWAVVADGRKGLRPGDRGAGVYVSWLHTR